MKTALTLIFASLLATAPAWAINKCTGGDGKFVFQDAPCTGKGEKIEIRPASGVGRAASPSASASPAVPAVPAVPAQAGSVAPPAPVAAPPEQPPAQAAKSPLEREADQCLAWYRPQLRDPAGAYFTEPSKEGRVVSITVHATNGFGGYVTRRAGCEIHMGKLNETWTKIHAERAGW